MKKKILFLMKYPLDDIYSIKIKFNGQMNAVKRLGYEVYYIAYDKNYTYLINGERREIIKKICFGGMKGYIHTKAFYDLFDSALKVLSDNKNKFDIIYMRSCPLNRKGYLVCKLIKEKNMKLVIEIPTYPQENEKTTSILRRIYSYYSNYWWNKSEKNVTLFTLIGEKSNYFHGIPAINIDNGISIEQVPERVYKEKNMNEPIQLLALASMSRWHGYDRIIKGIAKASDEIKQKVILNMVGDEGDGSLLEWKKLVHEYSLEDYVIFHGRKTGKELDDICNNSDVGICSLGLYRTGFTYGSILKLREYMARGIPFIYAANDPAIVGGLDFCMKVSNDESLIEIENVIDFAYKVRNNTILSKSMRKYAQNRMSWEAQFQKVFEALNSVDNKGI